MKGIQVFFTVKIYYLIYFENDYCILYLKLYLPKCCLHFQKSIFKRTADDVLHLSPYFELYTLYETI